MTTLPPALEKLIILFSRLPGIGERSATRLAFFVLSQPNDYARSMAGVLDELHAEVRFCTECHMISKATLCTICLDPSRDRETVCVVEHVQDVLAFERSGAFKGLYHVLHGVLAPLKGIGPEALRLTNLPDRLEKLAPQEVILATNTGLEGEATALYVARRLAPFDLSVSRIATGIPMGGELEYTDHHTLSQALQGRRAIDVEARH